MYSEVRAFLKKDALVATKYLSIRTLSNDSLILSEDHLVYARKFSNDEFNPM